MTLAPESTFATDADMFRQHFPVLEYTTHLAGCSLAPRSSALDAALARMLCAMDHLGNAWPAFEDELAQVRFGLARFIGAEPERLAMLPGASVGAYQVASTFDWAARSVIVTSDWEFPSLAHVWLAQRDRGADVRFASLSDGTSGADLVDAYVAAIDERTALVSLPLVHYRTGARLDVAPVVARAHQVGARVLVDAYQALGVLPLHVEELGCDFLVAGTSKYMLGLPGLGCLYARDLDGRTPTLTGWFGRRDPLAFDPRTLDFPDDTRRFEIGTPPVPAVYAAGAGLELLDGLDPDQVWAHVHALTGRAVDGLAERGIPMVGPTVASERGPMVSIAVPEAHAATSALARQRVMLSPRGGLLRAAFHFYNDESDVDRLCQTLHDHLMSTSDGHD